MSKQYNQIRNDNSNGPVQNKYMDTIVSQSIQTTGMSSNGYLFNPTGVSISNGIVFNEPNTMNFYTNSLHRIGISDTGIQSRSRFICATGSASTPSYSFIGDTDTGVTSNGANEISLVIGGYTTMRTSQSSGTEFQPVSSIHDISMSTPGGDTGIIVNSTAQSDRSRFDIQNTTNATTTSRYMSFGYNNQNAIAMYYNGTLRFLKNGSVGPPVGSADTLGGNGVRLLLWPGNVSEPGYMMGIDGGAQWYSVPSGGTHRFYTGSGLSSLLLTSGTARMNMGSTSESVTFLGDATSTNIRLNDDATSNYSEVDFANVSNATSTSRYLFVGYVGSDSSFQISNNSTFEPRTTSQTDLGSTGLRWKTLYADTLSDRDYPFVRQQLTASIASIANNTLTTFNPNTVFIGANLIGSISYSGGISTITLAGVYMYSYDIVWDYTANLGTRRTWVLLTSSSFGASARFAQNGYDITTGTSTGNRMSGCSVMYCAVGDTLQVQVYQISGTSLQLIPSSVSVAHCKANLVQLF